MKWELPLSTILEYDPFPIIQIVNFSKSTFFRNSIPEMKKKTQYRLGPLGLLHDEQSAPPPPVTLSRDLLKASSYLILSVKLNSHS